MADPFALPASFWSKVDKSGGEDACWLWTGGGRGKGYGGFRRGREKHYAHRAALQWHTRKAGEGLLATHGPCHCRRCVNPAHLSWQTYKGNTGDMVRDGTQQRGERHGRSKLTEAKVLAIRADTRPYPQIATDYGIVKSAVCNIKNRQRWGGRVFRPVFLGQVRAKLKTTLFVRSMLLILTLVMKHKMVFTAAF